MCDVDQHRRRTLAQSRWCQGRHLGLILGLVVAAEALVLHALLRLDLPVIWSDDGAGYHRLAVNLIEHGVFSLDDSPPFRPSVFRAPGYPFFIALVYLIGVRSYVPLRVAQLALLAATSWLLFALASRFVSRKEAAIAALLCATYPTFVILPMNHLSEPLTTTLVVLFVVLLTRAIDGPGRGELWMPLAGVVAGACALVRPTMALLLPSAVGVFVLAGTTAPLRRRIALTTLALAGFLLCVLPWTIRNAAVTGEFIPVAESGKGFSLFLSSQQYKGLLSHRLTTPELSRARAEFERKTRSWALSSSRGPAREGDHFKDNAFLIRSDRAYQDLALEEFRSLTPRQFCRGLVVRLGFLWLATDFSYWEDGLVHLLFQAEQDVLAALVLLGCWLRRASLARDWPLWVVPVYITLMHLVFHAEIRYTYPARPFLLVYAGVALDRLVVVPEAPRPDRSERPATTA